MSDLAVYPQVVREDAPAIFASVDSIPKEYAHRISPWKTPIFLLVFSALSIGQILLVHYTDLKAIFPSGDYVYGEIFWGTHAIAFRVFSITFLTVFCMLWADSLKRRLSITSFAVFRYVAACVLLDLVLYIASTTMGVQFSLTMAEIISGLLGFAIFSLTLLENGRMPPPILVRQRGRGTYMAQVIWVGMLLALSAMVSIMVEIHEVLLVRFLHNIALLGGIGPGVFLVLPLFFLLLFCVAHLRRAFLKRKSYAPDVSVIIPAFNEEYIIERTIRALDSAAEGYGGHVTVLVVDNNSRDNTAAIANATLAECQHVKGRVIHETTAGKSFALNRGLAEVKTDLVIRVDADTQLQPGAIARAMSWFADARVGVVGGLPIVPGNGPFDRARQVETLVKHGFYSVALEAINGVVGVPGMFAVYRVRQLRALGGFVAGMNGEDTDISLRIAERGYRIVVDARVTYISEVPVTMRHMREQRLRWFRSVFHVSSRSRQIILGRSRSFRGKAILPYMLINSARRSMMVPLVVFGVIELFLGAGTTGLLKWQAVVAVVLGASVLVAILAALVNGQPRALLGLPDYFLFRFLRAYFTLESMLTIIVLPKRQPFQIG